MRAHGVVGRAFGRIASASARGRRGLSRQILPATTLALATCVAFLLGAATARAAGSATPGHPNIFNAGGAGARDIRTLALEIFGILSLVLLTVWIVLAIVVVRYRGRPESAASSTADNRKLEITWTLIPAVIVAVLLVLTLHTTQQLTFQDPAVQFGAVGHQWWWEFDFPAQHFVTANEIDVPEDQTVNVTLRSADVIHGFWIPQLTGKVQMIPGSVNHDVLVPIVLGTYRGECSNFCGVQHAQMDFLVHVVTSAQYATWLVQQQQAAASPTGPEAVAGAGLITTLPCAGCHTIRGTPMRGAIGPDLTHFGSRSSIGALVLTNTPAHLLRWIQNPQAVKPGCKMPQIKLSLQQQEELVAYLEELK